MRINLLLSALLLLVGTVAATEKVYKSIDESGQVHYSSVPPENAVNTKQMDLLPGPAEDQVLDAEQRAAEAASAAEALEMKRNAAREQEQAAQAAKMPKESVTPIELTGTSSNRRRPRPPIQLPSESPSGGEHPVFQPGAPSAPVPRLLPAGR